MNLFQRHWHESPELPIDIDRSRIMPEQIQRINLYYYRAGSRGFHAVILNKEDVSMAIFRV